MKKIISLLLAMIMVFSLATAVSADTVDNSDWTAPAREEAITLNKVYTVTGSTIDTLYPTETLEFSVAVPEGVTNPSGAMITADDLTVTGNSNQSIKIDLPEYDTVGIYEYVITENEGSAQGVGYTKASIALKVLVAYDYENSCLESTVVLATVSADENDDDGKVDTFTNTYDVGSLAVSKTVTGNLGDTSKYFEVTVTFNAAENVESDITYTGGKYTEVKTISADWTGTKAATIELKHGDTVTFVNIPAGVTYTVEEADYTEGDMNSANGYDAAEYAFSDSAKAIAKADADTVVITNNKATEVNTGISLDSAPYFVILAFAMFGMVALVSKKRYEV